MKKPKYKNTKTYADGIRFDSKAEAKRYVQLKALELSGEIQGLELQPKFEILPSYKKNGRTVRAITYRADFRYLKGGELIVEDVKSPVTANNSAYKLKKKLVEYFYPEITIREIIE